MTLTDWDEIERKMRASIEKQLKRNNHCQMHIRRVARNPFKIHKGHEIMNFAHVARPAYALAVRMCEEYGGKVCMRSYLNGKEVGRQNNNASRVYQF